MKKTSTLVLIFLITFAANAQDIPKEAILLGGTLSFGRQGNVTNGEDKVKTNTITLQPTIGKFYKNNRAAGINVFYSRYNKSDDTYKSNSYGAGIFLRQYIPLGKSFYIFAEEGGNFRTGKFEQDQTFLQYRTRSKQTTVSVNLYPGIAYMLTKKIQLELALNNLVSLNYQKENRTEVYSNGTPDFNSKNNSFFLATGISDAYAGNLAFGIRWLF